MTATLVALNPFRQIAQANNANRIAGINAILNAISQRIADQRGRFYPTGNEPAATVTNCPTNGDILPVAGTENGKPVIYIIAKTTDFTRIETNDAVYYPFDLAAYVVPTYISQIPVDPQYGKYTSNTDYDTGKVNGYSIKCDPAGGRVTICAEGTQQIPGVTEDFCVTR
jgi:hypothetical protein